MPVGEGFELPEQPDITFTKCEELDLLNHGCMFPKVFVTRVRRRAWKEMGKVDKVEVVNSSSASSMPLPWVASKNHVAFISANNWFRTSSPPTFASKKEKFP